jgi:hypothetical protein
VPYDPGFDRTVAHSSTLYFGASLRALEVLAREKGYQLVGSNSAGTNAFFVRRDVLGDVAGVDSADAWRETKVRQARDASGGLTYVSGLAAQLELIAEMPVLDIESGETQTVRRAMR